MLNDCLSAFLNTLETRGFVMTDQSTAERPLHDCCHFLPQIHALYAHNNETIGWLTVLRDHTAQARQRDNLRRTLHELQSAYSFLLYGATSNHTDPVIEFKSAVFDYHGLAEMLYK